MFISTSADPLIRISEIPEVLINQTGVEDTLYLCLKKNKIMLPLRHFRALCFNKGFIRLFIVKSQTIVLKKITCVLPCSIFNKTPSL